MSTIASFDPCSVGRRDINNYEKGFLQRRRFDPCSVGRRDIFHSPNKTTLWQSSFRSLFCRTQGYLIFITTHMGKQRAFRSLFCRTQGYQIIHP